MRGRERKTLLTVVLGFESFLHILGISHQAQATLRGIISKANRKRLFAFGAYPFFSFSL